MPLKRSLKSGVWRSPAGSRAAEETAAAERAVTLTTRLKNWRPNDAVKYRRLYFIIRTFLSYGLDVNSSPNASYTATPINMALVRCS